MIIRARNYYRLSSYQGIGRIMRKIILPALTVFNHVLTFILEIFGFLGLLFCTRAALSAENIFLRKHLYKERKIKTHRACNTI